MFFEALAIGAGIAALHFWFFARRWEKTHRLLLDGYPEEFLKEVEKEMARTRDPQMLAVLTISQTAGLAYLGRFREAIHLMEELDQKHLRSPEFKAVYYNNLLYHLLLNREYERARQIMAEQTRWLVPDYRHQDLNMSLRGTLAIFDYFVGNLAEARSELERLVASDRPALTRASHLYFLGRLDLHEGRVEEGLAKLKETASLAPRTFFPREIQALSNSDEWIGAPGAAAYS